MEERWWMLKIRGFSLTEIWILIVHLEKVAQLNEQDQTISVSTNCTSNLQGKSV